MDGCGMAMQTYVIVKCPKCRRLSSKYLGDLGFDVDGALLQSKRCCHCHCRCGGLQVYEVPESGIGECPGCGETTLKFTETMLWD